MADDINTHDAATMNGAIYFIVGKGTEGGPHSYELAVAGITGSSKPGHQWGDVQGVAANSGYSIGTIQVDLGQRGDWPLGSIKDSELKPGEKSYIDAIVDQSAGYARQNGLKFTNDMNGLRGDLHTHGKNLKFIDKDTIDSINKWAASDEGKKWIHDKIDYPQSKNISDKAISMVDQYGKNIPENRRLETISIIAKTENQIPGLNSRFEETLKSGGDYDSVLKTAEKIQNNPKYSYYAGLTAAEKAEKYAAATKDPAVKESLDRALSKVASRDYNPAGEKSDADIKLALKVVGGTGLAHHVERGQGLKQGMHSEQVAKLQAQLGELGYLDSSVAPDGKFGSVTRDAVKAYQHNHHLPEVGQAGPATQKALQADLQPLRQDNPGPLPALSAMPSLPASAPGLDDPRNAFNPNHALFNQLQQRIPDASEQRLLQFTAVCHSQGITDRNLTDIHFDRQNGVMNFGGSQNFVAKTASVDLKEPSPPPTQSMQHIQQADQYQAQVQTQVQATIAQNNQQALQGPTQGGAPGR